MDQALTEYRVMSMRYKSTLYVRIGCSRQCGVRVVSGHGLRGFTESRVQVEKEDEQKIICHDWGDT